MAMLLVLAACSNTPEQTDDLGDLQVTTKAPVRDKPYSEELEKRIAAELNAGNRIEVRPDYLPDVMFAQLPDFPTDFYSVRTLVRSGRIADLEELEPRYWQQPEFFPKFEEIGVPLLQNPPEGRWGAYGLASYPAESIATIEAGDSIDLYFFMRSNYLVETYQGVSLKPYFPNYLDISTGIEMPDGTKEVRQENVAGYFTVDTSPEVFLLEPNFPLFRINGTKKIKVTITVDPSTPEGNYIVALTTGDLPEEQEQVWLKRYLTKYVGAGMTKLDRPYYAAFINVKRGGN